jgi:hypothetical protein
MKEYWDMFRNFELPAIIAIIIAAWFINSSFTYQFASFADKFDKFREEVRVEFKNVREENRLEFKENRVLISDIDKRLYRIEGNSSFCLREKKSNSSEPQ